MGEAIVDLARLLQDAALDPAQWEPALNAVNTFVDGSGAVLLTVDARTKFTPASSDMADMMDDYFRRGWHANDRREACIPLLKRKGIVVDHDFQTVEEIERCDFYTDFLARHRRKWFAGVGVEVDGDHWCLSLQRSPDSDPFSTRDLAKLRVLQNALADTAHLSRRLGENWISGLQHALSLVGQPAILVDTNARVLDLNDEAARIVGPFIRGDRGIRFGSPGATASFHAILRSAMLPVRLIHADARGQTIPVGDTSYHVRAISLLGHKGLIACKAVVLVLLEQVVDAPEDLMRDRYGLTAVEVKVAMALADGKSVPEAADENRIKAETVRAYLKSIYRKADVRKQSQLVALIRQLEAH